MSELRIKTTIDPEVAKQLDKIHRIASPLPEIERKGSHVKINFPQSNIKDLILPKGIELEKIDVKGKEFLVFRDTRKKSPGFKVGNTYSREIYVSWDNEPKTAWYDDERIPYKSRTPLRWSMQYKTKNGKLKSNSGRISGSFQNFLDERMVGVYSEECKNYGADRYGRVEIQGRVVSGKHRNSEGKLVSSYVRGSSLFLSRNEFTGKINLFPGKRWRDSRTEAEAFQKEGMLYVKTTHRILPGKGGGSKNMERVYRIWFSPGYKSFTAEQVKLK